MNRGGKLNKIVHVINVDIKDDDENAKIGSKAILELADMLNDKIEQCEKDDIPFEDCIMDILTEWQSSHSQLPSLYAPSYY
jgi:RNA polymerase II subunit A C-terminal domain phosphatase SSU72